MTSADHRSVGWDSEKEAAELNRKIPGGCSEAAFALCTCKRSV